MSSPYTEATGPEGFLEVFGRPDPAVPCGLEYTDELVADIFTEDLLTPIGAGWFWDRFLFMWGEGLDALEPCVEAWSFMLPPHEEHKILGRNAYGALLLQLEPNDFGQQSIWTLDPLWASCWTDGETEHLRWVYGRAPRLWWRNFFDRSAYDAWLATEPPVRMELEHCLAPKAPLSLGGTMELDNFQLEPIIGHYETRAPIFRKLREGGFEPGA